MSRISCNETIKQFEKPTDVVSAKICNESGLFATKYCTDTRTEYYLPDTVLPPIARSTAILITATEANTKELFQNTTRPKKIPQEMMLQVIPPIMGRNRNCASSKASNAGTTETENTGAAASQIFNSNTTTSAASDTAEETAADEEAATGTATENTTGILPET